MVIYRPVARLRGAGRRPGRAVAMVGARKCDILATVPRQPACRRGPMPGYTNAFRLTRPYRAASEHGRGEADDVDSQVHIRPGRSNGLDAGRLHAVDP